MKAKTNFAKALETPDFEFAKRSAALMNAEREKKQLATYIVRLEKEQKMLCTHIQKQNGEIAELKAALKELQQRMSPEMAINVVDPMAGDASAPEARTKGAVNLT